MLKNENVLFNNNVVLIILYYILFNNSFIIFIYKIKRRGHRKNFFEALANFEARIKNVSLKTRRAHKFHYRDSELGPSSEFFIELGTRDPPPLLLLYIALGRNVVTDQSA